jgi:transposase
MWRTKLDEAHRDALRRMIESGPIAAIHGVVRWRLMAYLGLVPTERSTGDQIRRGSITKAGNPRARRVLIEGAWTYRYPARLSRVLQVRQESLPKTVQAIAWKAQLRLCARYRRLMAAGKRRTLVTTAIAREMAVFLWAIGHEVEPRSAG